MDPMGTITQYFPFIKEETRSILDKVMVETSDYHNFVQRLCELVQKKNLDFLSGKPEIAH